MNFLDGSPVLLDAPGNTLAQRGVTMTYNQANRLATVGNIGPLTYNADGQRTTKPVPTGTTVFHYGMDGQLLAETTDAGSLIRVYFWAEDMPIAQMDTELTYLHADHLDTPRIGTNSSGAIVWQWNSDAFGSLLPNEDPDGNGTPTTVNLRFPGQYFDKETNLRYNYFRDYDPRIGRYLESDPIGLMGGLNTFGYVGQNPLGFVDPTGECPACIAATVGAFVGAGTDLTLQLIQNGGTGSNLSFRSIRTSALAGTAFSTLGPTGLLLGRGGARSLPYGYSRYAGILNHGNVRFGWGYRRADDSNVLRSVINGRKTDIRGVRVSPRANPIRDGAVSGATGGGVKRAIGDSDNCKE